MRICSVESCYRRSVNELCRLHQTAKENLDMVFLDWKIAYGPDFSWEDYLRTLSREDVSTGEMVEDILEMELKLLDT